MSTLATDGVITISGRMAFNWLDFELDNPSDVDNEQIGEGREEQHEPEIPIADGARSAEVDQSQPGWQAAPVAQQEDRRQPKPCSGG